ncbi:MAG TPA: DUF6519 domain-containing protein [Methanothrix sp.]|nr:DUF6519 domain-containing protein [Methanothrix sp.]
MKGDFSRFTFDLKKHYCGVKMQQGRVLLDSDWNEQADIIDHLSEIKSKDIIGRSGGPIGQIGFNIIQTEDDLTTEEWNQIELQSPLGKDMRKKIDNVNPGDFLISAGRYYVDGIVCENERALYYSEQEHLPKLLNDVTNYEIERMFFPYIVYLDVWKRHVSAIEDPEIRETALGGPDTATREQTVWQVRAVMPRMEYQDGCIDVSEIFPSLSTGRLNVRLSTSASASKSSKCSMAPSGGYQGLENRLYRVEIHDSGQPFGWQVNMAGREFLGYPDNSGIYQIEYPQPSGDEILDEKDRLIVVKDWYPDGQPWKKGQMVEIFPLASKKVGTIARVIEADHSKMRLKLDQDISKLATLEMPDLMFHRVATFKWSRDNGSIAYSIESFPNDQPNRVLVKSLGRDKSLSLRAGDCVEILGDATELACEPGTMALISENGADEASREISLDRDVSGHRNEAYPKIRRWDRSRSSSSEDMASPITLNEIELEDGISICFSRDPSADNAIAPSFRTGDYWTFPARTMDGKPKELKDAPAQGIEHHYACLARIPVNSIGKDGNSLSADKISFGKRSDCRKFFPSSRDIESIYYLGGDGQEALPGLTLENPLIIGVSRGKWPVADAQVYFNVISGGGKIEPQKLSGINYTEEDGVYAGKWKLGTWGSQVAEAFLFNGFERVGCPVIFHANLSIPSLVCISGDNQEIMPDPSKAVIDPLAKLSFIPLAQSVTVKVTKDNKPISDAVVKFRPLGGKVSSIDNKNISNEISVKVDQSGIARCTWYLSLALEGGHYRIYQELEATLESYCGANPTSFGSAISLRFTARLNAANEISFDPSSCPKIDARLGTAAMTVQDAINRLCPANILYAVSGNGQVGVPGQTLILYVGVLDSRGPVASVPVGFAVRYGGGSTAASKVTDNTGIAKCEWTIGKSGDQQVEAYLADSNGGKINGTISVYFNASLISASQVAYSPQPDCPIMSGASTVQNAINSLCDRGLHITRTFAVDESDNKISLDENMTLYAGQLTRNGLTIGFDDDIDPNAFSGKASKLPVRVIIELPYPLRGEEVSAWNSTDIIGYRQLILDGSAEVSSSKRTITWKPSDATARYLINQLFYSTAVPNRTIIRTPSWLYVSVLARLILKGNLIWSATDPKRYLKPGEDGKRGADFEIRFWLDPWYKCYASALSITMQLASARVKGATSTVLTVNMNYPAPVGGVLITLQSSSESVAKVESDTMLIPAGKQFGSININTFALDKDSSARITAITLIGNATSSVDLTVTSK